MSEFVGKVKEKVHAQVEGELVEATALAIRQDVANVSQVVMKDEIEASHFQNIGMMAIENAIDSDRSQYEQQLDQLRVAVEKAKADLAKAVDSREKSVKDFQDQLCRTELRKKYSRALQTLSRLSDLDKPFRRPEDDTDSGTFELSCVLPHEVQADDPMKNGFIKWSFGISQGSGYHAAIVQFSGKRALGGRCTEAYRAEMALKKDIEDLMGLNRDVRLQIQNLERERRDLQRKLRQQIVSKSILGSQIEDMLKKGRTQVKRLALPCKYQS